MDKKIKVAILVLNSLLSALIIASTALFLGGWGVPVKVICYALGSVGFIFGIVTYAIDKQALFKSAFVIVVCAFVIVAAVAIISQTLHLERYGSDKEKIERLTELIKNTGKWGMAVYVLIQILQVVVLPLPAVVCYVPGSYIWGPLVATILASLGVIIGSVIAYFIGRFLGKKAVIWIAGKEATEKYVSYIGNRGKFVFLIMQVLPFFPDDILCMIAGLTSMSFPFFMVVIVLVRPFIIAAYCYLAGGTLIPFSGWGIPVWITVFAVCIVLAVLSFKYQDKIEKWLVSKFRRKVKNKDAAPAHEKSDPSGDDTKDINDS